MENQIVLKQSPVIVHKLQEAGKNVQKRIAELELDKQIATEETVKSMKALRAELNKEVKDFETQRGLIKKAVNDPYLEFEIVYKTEITDRYKTATDLLKEKIDSVELKIKREKQDNVIEYFNELCQSEKIDFIAFEKLGLDINLSTTEKKYKEQVNEYVMKVVDDLNLIKTTDFEAEILTEYKTSLNVSLAITTVKTRKENEAKEQARLKAEQTQNRKNYLQKLGLNYVEITNAYEFNADIYVSLSDVNNMSKEAFTAKYAEIEAKISDIKAKEVEVVEEVKTTNTMGMGVQESPITNPPKKVVSAPVSAPVMEAVEELKTASFEVTATMAKLRALGEFMKQNGITYKNI